MPLVQSRADSLRLGISPNDIVSLESVGEIPGVLVVDRAARNGVGIGELSYAVASGLSWKAPGSKLAGVGVAAATDGEYLLEDGEDAGKWIRVDVKSAFLRGGSSSRVYTKEVYENNISKDDVTAAEASAGDVLSWFTHMRNVGDRWLRRIAVWIEAGVSGLEISDDNVVWVSPTTEATGLAFADLAAGGFHILYLRRTIAAGAGFDPAVLHALHFRFYRA